MIARVWRGWTTRENADRYDAFLRTVLFPDISRNVAGFRRGHVFRRSDGGEEEFLVMTLFQSLENVQGFAGADIDVPVIEPEAAALLLRGEDRVLHYEMSGDLAV